MKRLLLILTLLFSTTIYIAACGSKNDKISSDSQKQSNETKSSDSKPQGSSDTKSSDSKITDGIEDLSYDIGSLVNDFKYEGNYIAGAKWKDKNGLNVVLITETELKRVKSGDEYKNSKEIFGYHYIKSGAESKLLWKINDFVKDCEFDLTLNYINSSLSITDINKDGIGESTFLYLMSCKSDVSPDDMKLMMHDGDSKFAIRGTQKLKMGKESYGGEMNVDKSFNDAPAGFLDYAKQQWNKNQNSKLSQ